MTTSGPDERSEQDRPERDIVKAVALAVDESRLLDYEDPATTRLSDVIHWMAVYGELHALKDDLIEATSRRLAEMNPAAAGEVKASDLVILRAERERFARRLEFWKARRRELEDRENPGRQEAPTPRHGE